ncbi:gamma-glutamylcyclotransferase, partial [Haemophilus parainfluenzae]|uniref:gamma-glutamylcyclotransferase n=1 Tax=Haemophilus parainfluenzae TaxID=729 RepID=UPI001CED6D90
MLDVIPDPAAVVHGVLYHLPWRLSAALDQREEGYHRETITVQCGGRPYPQTRTYTVTEKLQREIPPNDGYFNVVLRGALTCGLPDSYCWELFHHMHSLQRQA